MKKLFLILASVLVLGGCSVDDDISASGGDDMAITIYPNVVEASRTVVEGGYLVDYVFYPNNLLKNAGEGVKEFILVVADKLGVEVSNSASFVEELAQEFYRVFGFSFKLRVSSSVYGYNNYEFFKTSSSGICFYLVGVGSQSKIPEFFYSSAYKELRVENLSGDYFSIGKFTIFEPTN